MRALTFATAALLTVAPAARAQACLGNPAPLSLTADWQHPDSLRTIGAALGARLSGAPALRFGIARSADGGVTGHTYEARAAWELPDLEFSLCPTAGLRLDYMSYGAYHPLTRKTAWTAPLGLGIGLTVDESDGVGATFYVRPELRLVYATGTASEGPGTEETEAYGAVVTGLLFRFSRYLVGGRFAFRMGERPADSIALEVGYVLR